jgi:predicted nucleic acid-binding protein
MSMNAMPKTTLAFIDTSAWCAFLSAADRNHVSAINAIKSRERDGLVTTTRVAEELSRLTYAYDNTDAAIRFAVHIWRGDFAYVLCPGERLEQLAWETFKISRKRGVSFVDCVSAAVVAEYEIVDLIAYGAGLRSLVSSDKYAWLHGTDSKGR